MNSKAAAFLAKDPRVLAYVWSKSVFAQLSLMNVSVYRMLFLASPLGFRV